MYSDSMYSESMPPAAEQKNKIMIPPTQYHLIPSTVDRVCAHIDQLTRFDLVSPDYLARLKQIMRERHQFKPVIFGYMRAPLTEAITRQVIGTNGYFFKMTTTLCDAYFIWHDTESHLFLFWAASTFKIVKAMNSIRWRIGKCSTQPAAAPAPAAQPAAQQPADATDDDMPGLISIIPGDSDDDMPDLVSITSDDDDELPLRISSGSAPDYEHPEPF